MHNWATLKEDTKWECYFCKEFHDDRDYLWMREYEFGNVCGDCTEENNL